MLNLNITTAVEAERRETIRTVNNATYFNVTGLLPDTRYELSVLSVYDESRIDTSVVNSRAIRESSVVLRTGTTGKPTVLEQHVLVRIEPLMVLHSGVQRC